MKTLTLDTLYENFWTNGILFHAYNLFHKKNIKGAINHLLPLLYNMGMIFTLMPYFHSPSAHKNYISHGHKTFLYIVL